MKKEITAAYMHKLLKESLFSEVDLTHIPEMSDEERRAFNIQQLDRIIGMRSHADALGWFIGQFIHHEGERREDNPLYEEEGTPLVDWYLELLWLGYELYEHIPFDLDLLVPGLAQDKNDPENDFTIDNAPLCDWLTTTPYRFVAMLVGRIMLEVEYSKVVGSNDAEQDYYAEHCSTDNFYTNDPEEARQAVQMLLDGLKEIRSHREQGRQLGLSIEQERVVDSLAHRACVIAWLKACVLYVANGCKWEKGIETFVRWSLQNDLWCKMHYFGEMLENGADKYAVPHHGPRNQLQMLPNVYTLDDVKTVRLKCGMKEDGADAQNRQWISRGFVEAVTDVTVQNKTFRKLKYLTA